MKRQASSLRLVLAAACAIAQACGGTPAPAPAPVAVSPSAARPALPAPAGDRGRPALLTAARAAAGGDAWDRVQAIETRATVALGKLTGTVESIEDVARGRGRSAMHLGPLEVQSGIDGAGEWDRAPGGEVVRHDAPDAVARARTRAWMIRRGYLRDGGARYRDLGARQDGDRRLRGLEATPDGGAPIELWFDDAARLARSSQQIASFTIVTDYGDWRDVDGVLLAFRSVVDRGDPRARATVTVTEAHRRSAPADDAIAAPGTDADRLRFAGGARSTDVGFDLINNHIHVRASIDGQPVRLLVDTGGANLVTAAAAARLGLSTQGDLPVAGVGDRPAGAGVAHGKTLQLGDAVLARPVFYVVDLGELADVEGEDLDGLIGYELFARLAVRIDYPRQRLILTEPSAFAPPAGAIAVPFEVASRVPVVRGSIDGIEGRFWVDTGSRLSVSTMAGFTRDHDLVGKYHPRFETVTGWGIGGASRSRPVRLRTVAIGGATVHDVVGDLFAGGTGAFNNRDAAANLGAGVLRRFVVTFDYAHRTMYLEPGPAADAREIYDRSGLFLIRADAGKALKVAAVTPGGPAERAGVRADDRIVAIDGAAIETRPLWQWRAYLREHAPGTRVVLRLQSTGAARDVAIALAELVP